MVTIRQIQSGVFKYVRNDLVPRADGFKKIALIGFTNLATEETAFENYVQLACEYINHPMVKALEVTSANGDINIDKLYNALAPAFDNGVRHALQIPLLGPLIVDRSDLDKLHRYILGG